jgi:hypothetical protein
LQWKKTIGSPIKLIASLHFFLYNLFKIFFQGGNEMISRYSFYGVLISAIILSLTLLIGCAKPPTKEVENAENAIGEAKQIEADLYAQDIFTEAEDSLKKAKDLIAAKNYKEAKTAAEEAAKFAKQAISTVEPNKTKMREEAEKMIQDVQKSMDEVKTLTATAIKKKAPINREDIQSTIGKSEVDMVSIKDQLQAQKIRQAYDQLKAMAEYLKSQKENLTAALEQKSAVKK